MDILVWYTTWVNTLPAWIHAATLLVSAMSAVAALTPTQADDTFVAQLMKYVDWVALNFGNAGKHKDNL